MNRLYFAAPLLLVACNSQPTIKAENASVAEVAAQARGAVKIEPGQWSHQTDVVSFDMPGVKDQNMARIMGDAMKKAQSKTISYCITPEEAAKPRFGETPGADCRYENFTMGSGRIDATMVCKPKQGGAMRMAMAGTYSPTAYDMTVDMKMDNPQMPGGGMTMKAHTKGARTGACAS